MNNPNQTFQDTKLNVLPSRKLRWTLIGLAVTAFAGLVSALFLWSKLSSIEELLAKQSAQSNSQSLEAKVSSKDAQELARETAAKLALLEAKVTEVALQRAQLEELMQSLSRTRDENLVTEVEASLKIAQQQSLLTGSAQPLIQALKNAEQHISKSSQPKILSIQRALIRDIDLIKSAPVLDTPGLLLKLDQLVQKAEDLPLLNEPQLKPVMPLASIPNNSTIDTPIPPISSSVSLKESPQNPSPPKTLVQSILEDTANYGWQLVSMHIWEQIKGLVRITHIDQPEASLLAPSQGYFLRENLKLRMLNAKLGLLAHQPSSFKLDIFECDKQLNKFFDMQSKQGQSVSVLIKEIQTLSLQTDIPSVQNTWAAIGAASMGN